MIIQDGLRVSEVFVDEFNASVERDVRTSELVRYELIVQDGLNVCLSCVACYASEYLAFNDALASELDKHGIAIVHSVLFGDKFDKRSELIDIVVSE